MGCLYKRKSKIPNGYWDASIQKKKKKPDKDIGKN